MRLQVPVYVRDERRGGRAAWCLRPVLHEGPVVRHADIDRALQLMAEELRRAVVAWAAAGDHDAIARLAADPGLDERRVAVNVEQRGAYLAGKVLVATMPAPGGMACFLLDHGGDWFHVAEGRDLGTRVSEAMAPLVRALVAAEREPSQLLASRRGWIAPVEVEADIDPLREPRRRADEARASLGASEEMDGATQLSRVGMLLGRDAAPAPTHGRESELAELLGLLAAQERRAVLLVGPPGAGKTSLAQAAAYARRHDRRHGQIWHLSPGRLIAGMSFVGQWEARLEAICRHAEQRDHVLHIDDLVGLLRAGVSASSSLGAARVLKRWLEEGRVRVLAEATWEALQVVQELDRGFADLLRPLPLAPLGEAAAGAAVVRLVAELEAGGGVAFQPDGLRAALALARRYRPDHAMPGAAADLLRALAVSGGTVDRAAVLGHFSRASGIPMAMLDATVRVDRAGLAAALRREVVGQDQAVDALVDAVTLAKAGMADPARPLQSVLFLGPTGVGKTQCARALASALFGSPERLLRFDLNEYAGGDAVERLAGSLARPEGALVAAIRRQPYAVVLLDEIEKADPGVLDLLLQVLGEARLTDAVGRTASFANAVVIMTSNLGVREAAGATLGFTGDARTAAGAFRGAVDAFFRPELVARIDRIVAFDPLDDGELRTIVRAALAEAARRPGLARRRWLLEHDDAVVARLAGSALAQGTGGRAVRRAVVDAVLRPLAESLAASGATAPGVARIVAQAAGVGVETRSFALAPADLARALPVFDPAAALARCERLRERVDAARPRGPIELGTLGPDVAVQFEVGERLTRLRRHLHERCERARRLGSDPQEPDVDAGRRCDPAAIWRRWSDGEALTDALADTDAPVDAERLDRSAIELTLLAHAVERGYAEVEVRAAFADADADDPRRAAMAALLGEWEATGLNAAAAGSGRWLVHGPAAAAIVGGAVGLHLVIDASGGIRPLIVAIGDTVDPAAPLVRLVERSVVVDLALGRWSTALADSGRARAWTALRIGLEPA